MTRAVFTERGYGINPPNCSPQKLSTLFGNFSTLSLTIIIKKYCTFFSPKALCDTRKVLKRRLRLRLRMGPGCGSSRRSPDPLCSWGGDTHPQFPSPRRLWRLYVGARRCLTSVNLFRNFLQMATPSSMQILALGYH